MKIKMTLGDAMQMMRGLDSPQTSQVQDTDLTYAMEHTRRMLMRDIRNYQYKPSKEFMQFSMENQRIEQKYQQHQGNTPLDVANKKTEVLELEKKYASVIAETEKLENEFQEKLENEYDFEVHSITKASLPKNLNGPVMKALFLMIEV